MLFIVYFIGINLVTLWLMGYDKAQARSRGRRIPERTLFLCAAAGGAIGGIAGMRMFRHKTKHKSFVVGFPLLFLLNVALFYAVFLRHAA